jgi:KaiC/GvpD/RAD55 family RecA-like ATPase
MASWQHAATDDADAINNWYGGLYRTAGVGLALGPQPNGDYLFAIDVDTHDPAQDGWEALTELEAHHGKLPDTWRSLTGAGGGHLIFAAPAGVTVRNQQSSGNRIAPGIDVRGDGGQIVVAPTIHPDTGIAYAWEHGYAPDEVAVAQAPAWLLELVREREPQKAEPLTPRPEVSGDDVFDLHRAGWDWNTELLGRGWTLTKAHGNDTYWTRPGKDRRAGHSAVLHGNEGPFVVFTAEIDPTWTTAGSRTVDGSGWSFGPFGFYAATQHAGDRSAAVKALAIEYGLSYTQPNIADLIAPAAEPTDAGPDAYDADLLAMLIDWPAFWATDHKAEEWAWEPVIAAKRATAIFAAGGVGKSLIVLRMVLDMVNNGIRILYLDYEMTPDDLADRLADMGIDDRHELDGLHYAQLPSIPAFDTAEGGKAVRRLAQLVDAQIVIIDTFARAVEGDENDADTVRQFYRMTGLHLKADGRGFIRIDHAGKDATKGQRGSSAKNDDVDVVWHLKRTDTGYQLDAKKRRMGWVPETVHLDRTDDPFTLTVKGGASYPHGTADMARLLDEVGVGPGDSARAAATALRLAGHAARNEVVRAAQRYRRSLAANQQITDLVVPQPVDNTSQVDLTSGSKSAPQKSGRGQIPDGRGAVPGALTPETTKPQVDELGRGAGRGRAHPPDVDGAQCAPLYGAHAPNVTPEPAEPPDVSSIF